MQDKLIKVLWKCIFYISPETTVMIPEEEWTAYDDRALLRIINVILVAFTKLH